MIVFCPNIGRCPRMKQIANTFVGQCEQKEMLLMVHGPPLLQQYKIEDLILQGEFLQTFDVVSCVVFSSSVVGEKLEIKHKAMHNEA